MPSKLDPHLSAIDSWLTEEPNRPATGAALAQEGRRTA
jgi:hypothetical protein